MWYTKIEISSNSKRNWSVCSTDEEYILRPQSNLWRMEKLEPQLTESVYSTITMLPKELINIIVEYSKIEEPECVNYIETSSKDDINVTELFTKSAEYALKNKYLMERIHKKEKKVY